MWDDERVRRTLGTREKQILLERAGHKCEACGKELDYSEMQVGHKIAASKGGSASLRNSVCLCYRCNKLQGTDSWAAFMKKQGVEDPKAKLKQSLENLTLQQLKALTGKHHIRVTGYVEESLFSSRRIAPTKRQYVNKLAGVVTSAELRSVPKEPQL